MIRVLAWPRSPSRMMSWPASTAFSSWGRTVSSKPEHPGDQRLAGGDPGGGVAADLVGHRQRRPPGLAQGPERGDVRRRRQAGGEVDGGGVGRAEGSGVVMRRAYAGRRRRGARRPGRERRRAGPRPGRLFRTVAPSGGMISGQPAHRPLGLRASGRVPPHGRRPATATHVAGHGPMREKSIDDVGGRIASTGRSVTPVVLGGARGGPDVPTLRTDRYWVQPVVTFVVLTVVRGLRQLGRLREQELLRRRRRCTAT